MTVVEIQDPEVESKINELRRRIGNDMKPSMREDNNCFHRFLIARDYNLDQAEIMLRKHLQWRKENKVDTILTDPLGTTEKQIQNFEEVISYFGEAFLGFDKEHCPVTYFAIGNTDWRGLRMAAKWSDRYRYVVRLIEEQIALIEKQSKKLGKNVKGLVYIADMKNLSFAAATDKKFISELMVFATLYQDNYPERLKQIVFINVSNYFTMLFHIVKTVLAASILNKIKMYGQPEEYEPALLKLMDASNLPAFLGGKKTDPDGDPLCKSFVKHGGPVPPKLYICKNKSPLSKSKEAKKLVVPRASFSEIELKVKEANSMIEWEFETKTRDIGFGLFYKELESGDEEKIIELVPLTRLDTEDFSETGMFKCEKPGTYILLFDNSYSWMRSKELYYKTSVVSRKDHEKEMMS